MLLQPSLTILLHQLTSNMPSPVVLAYQIELSQQIQKAVLAAKNPDQLQPILSLEKGQHVVFPSSIALVVKVAMVACLPDLPQ
ncbi:hypothetical protein ACFX2B_009819 [Malus domestica]